MGFRDFLEDSLAALGLMDEEQLKAKREKIVAHETRLNDLNHKILDAEKENRGLPRAAYETTARVSRNFQVLKENQEGDLQRSKATMNSKRDECARNIQVLEEKQTKAIKEMHSKLDQIDGYLHEQLAMKKKQEERFAAILRKKEIEEKRKALDSLQPKSQEPKSATPSTVDAKPKTTEPSVQRPQPQEQKVPEPKRQVQRAEPPNMPDIKPADTKVAPPTPTPAPAPAPTSTLPTKTKPSNSKSLQLIIGGVFGVLIAILVSLILHIALRR